MATLTSAMEMLEEYAEDLIKITAPREKVVDGDVKTLQGWKDSGVESFYSYVNKDDKVSEDIVNYFIELVPPKCYKTGFVQVGEPYDSVKEGVRYATFIYLYKDNNYGGSVWQYKGSCLADSCERGIKR